MSLISKIVLIPLIFSVVIIGQNESILKPNTIYWSAWDFSGNFYHNQLKFNTVLTRAIGRSSDQSAFPVNLNALSAYDNIFAINNNAYSTGQEIAEIPKDYLYWISGGYYNIFYAADAATPTNQYVRLKKGDIGSLTFGSIKEINNKRYYSSGSNPDDIGKILLKGPDYFQHQKYLAHRKNLDRPVNYELFIRK